MLIDIKAKKVVAFFTTRNIEVKAKNEKIAWKIHRKSKLALLIVKIYFEQIYNYYQSYICSCKYIFNIRSTIY